MEEKIETVEVVEEVAEEEAVEPKVELTEEEAKIAAENVKQLIQLIDTYKLPRQKREEKLAKWKEEYENMSDDNYKKKQLASKIAWLERKLYPDVLWDSSKGTYVKSEQTEKVEETVTEE